MPVVYTGGTFDLFHAGHVNLLRECRALAGQSGSVVVSLNTDEFIEQYKGRGPVCNFSERESVLLSCRYVDQVISNFGGADSKPAILQAKPEIIVVGSDWKNKDYHSQMSFTPQWLSQHDIALVYVEYTSGISSTAIKQRLI